MIKRQFDDLLLGNLLTPVLALVLGCIFGLLFFVVSRGIGFNNPLPYGIAIIGGAIVAGGINALLNIRHRSDFH